MTETLTEWHSVGNFATNGDIHRLETKLAETQVEILKLMVLGAMGTQTFILLAALFGLLHSVVKL
jgi:hypothetical protein